MYRDPLKHTTVGLHSFANLGELGLKAIIQYTEVE